MRTMSLKTSITISGLATLLLACGGAATGKAVTPATAGSQSAAVAASGAEPGAPASGLPEWIMRGSGAFGGGRGRIFYGVGSAQGIKNPPLLRSTSDNRARNELAKVFETYSASLMKDYMSTEGQQVQQAVKTFTAMSLEGAEIIDRHLDDKGTMYSLAALDLDKAKAAVAKAKELGLVKSHVQQNADQVYDELAKMLKPTVAKAPPAQGGQTAPAAPVKQAADAPKPTKRTGKPAWVDGSDPDYPERQYLCGVGYGPTRGISENGAFASLSKIFEAKVASVSSDFQASYSRTGQKGMELQSIQSLTQVSTKTVLTGVQLYDMWEAPDKVVYTLACIKREPAAASLRDAIAEKDKTIGNLLSKAETDDAVKKIKALSQALDAIMVRAALNAQLRIVDPDGLGVASDYSFADIEAALEGAKESFNIGVVATGSNSSDMRAALVDGLTGMGFAVKAAGGGGDDDDDDDDDDDSSAGEGFDILITAKVRMENAGQGSGDAASISFVRAVCDIEIKKVSSGKVLASFTESQREGHRTVQEAQRRAVREMQKKLRAAIKKELDKYISGKK